MAGYIGGVFNSNLSGSAGWPVYLWNYLIIMILPDRYFSFAWVRYILLN